MTGGRGGAAADANALRLLGVYQPSALRSLNWQPP